MNEFFNKFIELSLPKTYKDSPNMFKLIFDKIHRPEIYYKIISNKKDKDENFNSSLYFDFSLMDKKEAASKISRYDSNQISRKELKDREYISNFLLSRFTKTCSMFFGILFSMNLFLIITIRRQLEYKFPFKATEDFIFKMKKIVRMKKLLFLSLILYEIGFGLLAIKNYNQYHLISKQILPDLEDDLASNYKLDLDEYIQLFSTDKII